MSKEWEGPGKMQDFLLNLTEEKLDEAINDGFDLNFTYQAIAPGDGAVIASSTPLHLAARYGYLQSFKLILSKGAKIDSLDDNGLNPLSYSCCAILRECSLYLLTAGCPVQDGPNLAFILSSDDAIEVASLFLMYGKGLSNFLSIIQSCKTSQFQRFASRLEGESCTSICISYLAAKTPDWCSMANDLSVTSERAENAIHSIEDLSKLDHSSNIADFASHLNSDICNLILEVGKLQSDMRAYFNDYQYYLDFLEKMEQFLSMTDKYSKDKSQSYIDSIIDTKNACPIIHLPIASSFRGADYSPKQIMDEIIKHKEENSFDFDGFKANLSNFGKRIEKMETFLAEVNCILKAKAADFNLKESMRKYAYSMVGTEYPKPESTINEVNEENILQMQKLTMLCARQQWQRPRIGSGYEPTTGEKSAMEITEKMEKVFQIEAEVAELKEGIAEFERFPSSCCSCGKYVAVYICPFCHCLLYCLLCKKTNTDCPKCHKHFEEPECLRKTCFFGEEYGLITERNRQVK